MPGDSDTQQRDDDSSADDEIVEDDAFDGSDDEQEAINIAHAVAAGVLGMLREQFGEVRHWLYPFGTLCVTTELDHSQGLGLDPSPDAGDSFTVLRGYGSGKFDVVMFKRQPRTTLVGFPHDPKTADRVVGLRARALLMSDVAWCEDFSDDSEDEYASRVGGGGGRSSLSDVGTRLRVRKLRPAPPAASSAGAQTQEDERAASAAATLVPPPSSRERWASAPELEQLLAGEVIGTREQVIACLKLQGAFRCSRRRASSAQ